MAPQTGANGERLYTREEISKMDDETMISMASDAIAAMVQMAERLESVLKPASRN